MLAEPPAAAGAGDGPADETATITPSFERGALILRDADGRFRRLSWGELEEPRRPAADRRRALPAGAYHLAGYRILRRDDAGAEWHVSATARSIRELKLVAGANLEVDVDQGILIRKAVRARSLNMAIQGDGKAGLSIYKEGRRIPMGYRLEAADGGVLEGRFRYG